ncbi:hypothetical protein FDJ32_gp39 [Pseudomonas phage NV1]|uniref:Uncharacterized protein n=1 Tax=Pseudomonas phage NV1 TaxID=2079543 RepID=A0A2L0HPM8_9CAUD|nr:hypothetical protein FDJ32_gp39 [Pseudomonas phage NV1]AUX83668.1 hypothetical protein NV1_p39 [Pseudomonas phage NV1]
MTLQITSFDHGMEVALATVHKIDALGYKFVLAGGFMRDIDNGVQPKDMDFFFQGVPNGPGQTGSEGVDAAAKAVFDVLGHTYRKFTAQTDQEYPEGLIVYESVEVPDGDFPANLIFTAPGTQHPVEFDIAFCNIQLYKGMAFLHNPGDELWKVHRGYQYEADKEQKLLTVNGIHDQYTLMYSPERPAFEPAMVRFLGHLRRVMEKYPDHRPVIGMYYIEDEEGRKVYNRLIEENIFGDPRQVLPAERQVIDWDEFRQPDREEGLGQAELQFARGVAGPDFVEATLARLRDIPQVQPRPAVEDEWAGEAPAWAGAAPNVVPPVFAGAVAPQGF